MNCLLKITLKFKNQKKSIKFHFYIEKVPYFKKMISSAEKIVITFEF
jgi:hypothetical protein